MVYPRFAFLVAVLLVGAASAQAQVNTSTDLDNRSLKKTYVRVAHLGPLIPNVSCSPSGCGGDISLFAPNALTVHCPGTSGTCTLEITQCAQMNEILGNGLGDNEYFRFVVDDVAPSPGPTDPAGMIIVDSIGETGRHYRCATVFAAGKAAGAHTVRAFVGTQDRNGDGARTSFLTAELFVRVYKP